MVKHGVLAAALVCAGLLAARAEAVGGARTADQNTIGIIAGEPEWLPLIQDVAKTLNHQDGLRILPISGEGAVQSVNDLLNINGIDVALVPADSILYAKAQGLLPPGPDKISYLARMGTIKVLLVARNGTPGLTALAGKRIATGPAQSSGFATGELVLGALGLPFTRVPVDGVDAIGALERGEADAALVLGTQNLSALKSPSDFTVLSLPLPSEIEGSYAPALVASSEIERLGVAGGPVDTISTPLVLAVLNWKADSPQSSALYAFNKALLGAVNLPESDAQWIKNNLAAEVPNLARHASAKRALEEVSPGAAQTVEGATQ
jgi:ABC-type nitrate/sulfonate/bicarbonate transport system substrate-binding protein